MNGDKALNSQDTTQWHVRNTHSSESRMRWHKVFNFTASFPGGRQNRAHTVCKMVYDFPVNNTIFTDFAGKGTLSSRPPRHTMCMQGCYDDNGN